MWNSKAREQKLIHFIPYPPFCLRAYKWKHNLGVFLDIFVIKFERLCAIYLISTSVVQINGKVIQIKFNYSAQSNLILIKINGILKVIRIELN